MFSNSNN